MRVCTVYLYVDSLYNVLFTCLSLSLNVAAHVYMYNACYAQHRISRGNHGFFFLSRDSPDRLFLIRVIIICECNCLVSFRERERLAINCFPRCISYDRCHLWPRHCAAAAREKQLDITSGAIARAPQHGVCV